MSRRISRLLLALVLAAASAFAQRGAPLPEQLAFVPDRASAIYDVGETVGWTVTPPPNRSPTPTSGRSAGTTRLGELVRGGTFVPRVLAR